MKLPVISVLVALKFHFIDSSSFNVMQEFNCENKSKLPWLWNLRNNNLCLNLIYDSSVIPKCFFDQIFNSNFVVKTLDLSTIKSRNIFKFERENCDNFIVFAENSNNFFELFTKTNITQQRFSPFSQIFLVSSDSNVEFDISQLDYIYNNGLYVYSVKNTLQAAVSPSDFGFLALQDVLTKEILNLTISNRNDAIRYFGTYKNHPFFNSEFKKKIFRVSLFSCMPYVIYFPSGRYDGLEYRILKEAAKNWTIEHRKCDFSPTNNDPWGKVLDDVNNHISDLAMCSIWLNSWSNTHYDVSNYVDFQCGTFLVPKPKLINAAAFLYLSLGSEIWCGILVSFAVMSLSFTLLAKFGTKWMNCSWKDFVYVDLSRSMMDAWALGTSNGLENFPKQNSMRALFNSWIIVSLLVGVAYSTGYTSLLTKPLFTKPVDSIVQFLENDFSWVMRGSSSDQFTKTLTDSGVDSFIQLVKRIKSDNGTTENAVRVRNDGVAIFIKLISNNYITDIDEETDPEYKLRIMKSCFLNYYSVIAFKKYSSYTPFFNEKIRILQEFGIISYWGTSIEGMNNNYVRPYFKNLRKREGEPKKISFQNLSGAFWLLLSGLGTATTFFITENFVIYYRKSIRNRLLK